MKKTFITLCISIVMFFSASFSSAEESVGKKQLEDSISKLLGVLTDTELTNDPSTRRDKIKSILNARFSATEMAKRTLARKWKKISKEEQKEFANILRRLIISSYIGKIENYKDEAVIYRDEKLLKKRYMEIVTSVIGGKDTFSVNYKLKDFNGNWLIYDIYIEGVSLINNYRSQFKSILKKKKFPQLLADLKETLKQVENKRLQGAAKEVEDKDLQETTEKIEYKGTQKAKGNETES